MMWFTRTQRVPLPQLLSAQGYPVFALSLRRRWGRVIPDWDMDDYVEYDLPAALRAIKGLTGERYVHMVGHSMGGILMQMYQVVHGCEDLLSTTTLGSPGLRGRPGCAHFIATARPIIAVLSQVVHLARLNTVPTSLLNRVFLLSRTRWRTPKCRATDEPLRYPGINSFCANVSDKEVKQLTSLVTKMGIKSKRHGFAYGEHVDRVRAPLLAFAGEGDFIAPPQLVRQGYDEAYARRKIYRLAGPSSGCRGPYSHFDLVLSPRAPTDIWPHILNWLHANERCASG